MKWQSQSQWAKSNELLREKAIILLALNLTKAAQSPSWELNMINTYSKVHPCNQEMLWKQLQKEIKVFAWKIGKSAFNKLSKENTCFANRQELALLIFYTGSAARSCGWSCSSDKSPNLPYEETNMSVQV